MSSFLFFIYHSLHFSYSQRSLERQLRAGVPAGLARFLHRIYLDSPVAKLQEA
ncbi:MAG: hypothetical protein KAU31_02645 [Spirochaetaceae bacterium]|nr:hypothetical protein [Spirochaetaceae bacterium]